MNPPCEKCAPYNGQWMETSNGLRRCDCQRGQQMRAAAIPQPPRPPQIPETTANVCAEMMAAIPDFYPAAGPARGIIAHEIRCMCATDAEASWLAKRMIRLFKKWPGVDAMRSVYCARYKPLDGLQALSTIEAYPDGLPSEHETENTLGIEGQKPRMIAGDTLAPDFPTSALALLAQANGPVKRDLPPPATDAEIERIKAIQEGNRTAEQVLAGRKA